MIETTPFPMLVAAAYDVELKRACCHAPSATGQSCCIAGNGTP